jgi:TP901 family phage tail tape measure protein
MADSEANIRIDIDTSSALASIKNLQRQISAFHTQMQASGNAANAAMSRNMQKSLVDSINATGKFSANLSTIKSTTESFTNALEKNKLSMGEYFRYAGASTKTFGRLFRSEFDTIEKVSRERVKTLQTQYIKMGRDASGALQAINVRPLVLDMNNLATQTAMTAQKQQLFNQLVKQGSTNLLNWGKNTQWAGRQLMVGFTIPLTMLGTVASKTFMKLEEQAIRFRRVYGEMFTTTAETEKALAGIRDLANEFTKYGVAVEKTMELAADAAAMGQMGAGLTAQVAEATRLAVLGGVEQQEALKTTISLTSAFGVATEDLARKTDFLNAVENQTVVSIEDLTIAIPKAGPVVQQLGGDVEDLAFFLTAMKEGGINASEGANALKSGLASLINPTGKAAEMLAQFGINVKNIVESNKGDVKGLVIDFANALDTLDPLNRARAIEQLFGKFQFSRISTLFQNVIGQGNQASRVLQLSKATAEELAILSERELKRLEDSPAYKFKKAMEDLQASLAPFGEQFIKLVTPIIDFGTSLLKQFNNMSEGGKAFVTGLITTLGLIAPAALMTIGLVANGVANLAKGFNALRLFYQRLSGSSTELGSATQYMTQEQLEAAAVAASLNQSHAMLKQTFTSEAAALTQLIGVYQAATRAQLAMNAAAANQRISIAPPITRIPGGRRAQSPQGTIDGIPGYARGILSVPGPKGAGDVVPAMLSPGEAVIPARQSQKYSGIISSLIADNVPGFAFGRNPFASMLGKSRVAVRMGSGNFISALQSQGKNARYQSAFDTQSGADYLTKYGRQNPKQQKLRAKMESDVFGLDPKTTSGSARPTYGYAKTSVLQSIVNSLFGIKGRNFNALTRKPTDKSLGMYGDIDLITKGSVARRSSAYPGDILMDYYRAKSSGGRGTFQIAPMRGASAGQLSSFERLGMPFGSNLTPGTKNQYTTNPRSPYVETYTPGGFGFAEIEKVIASNPAMAKQIKSELKSAGLGSIRVTGPGFIARLFKKLGVPGYSKGIASVPGGSQSGLFQGLMSGTIGAALALTDQDRAVFRDLNLTGSQQKKYSELLGYTYSGGRSYRTVPTSLAMFDAAGSADIGRQILAKLAQANIGSQDAASIMSDAANESKTQLGAQKTLRAIDSLILTANQSGTKLGSGVLKKSFREAMGIQAFSIKKEFAHIGSGTKISAAEALRLSDQGILKLSPSQKRALQTVADPNATMLDLKSGFGFDIENKEIGPDGKLVRLNAQMAEGQNSDGSIKYAKGADKDALLREFRRSGISKWDRSIIFGGGDPAALAPQTKMFDDTITKILDDLPQGTKVVDSEASARYLESKGVKAISMERIYDLAKKRLPAGTKDLQYIFKRSQTSPAEIRNKDLPGFKSKGLERKPIGIPMRPLAKQFPGSKENLEYAKSPNTNFFKAFFRRRGFAFNKGVVSVPGPKGAGDIVPAMLSPGEAVIPAQMSKKYAPLINSMIADNVPGYVKGKTAPGGTLPNTAEPVQVELTQKSSRGLAGNLKQGFGDAARRAIAAATGVRAPGTGTAPADLDPTEPATAGKRSMAGRVGGVGMLAGTAAMMYSMTGGPASDLAGMASLPLMMLPMIANKIGLALVAVGALAAGIIYLTTKLSDATKAGLEAGKSMAMTSEKLNEMSEITGKVTASQIAERQREKQLSGQGAKKREFGQNFLESQAGKKLLSDAEAMTTSGMSSAEVASSIASQLSYAIMQGAITDQQARSIAFGLSEKLGDYSISANIGGKLTQLFGPNGENLLNGDPIEISLAIQKDSLAQQNKAFDNSIELMKKNAEVSGGSVGNLIGAGIMTAVGAALTATGIGGLLGIGLISGGVAAAGATLGVEALGDQEENNKARGVAVQLGAEQIAQNQGLLDSLERQYDGQISQLEAEKEAATTRKERLAIEKQISDKIAERNAGLAKQKAANAAVFDSLVEQARIMGSGFTDSINLAIDSRFANATGAMKAAADLAKSSLAGLEQGDFKTTLQIGLASGEFDPVTISNLINANKESNGNISSKFNLMVKAVGTADSNQVIQLLNAAGVEGKEYEAVFSLVTKDKADIDYNLKALAELNSMQSEYGIGVEITAENTEVIGNLVKDTKGLPKEVTQTVLTNFISTMPAGPSKGILESVLANWDVLSGGKKTMNAELIVDFAIGKYNQTAVDAWYYTVGPGKNIRSETAMSRITAEQRMAAFLGQPSETDGGTGTNTEGETTTTGAGAKKTTWIDDTLKKLKNLTNASINANGGLKELKRVIDGTKLNVFDGLGQKLAKAGISEAFADELMGMGKDARKKFVQIGKDGTAILTKAGKRREAAYARIAVGEFGLNQARTIQETKDQTVAVNRLVAAGLSLEEAYNAVENAGVAAALAGKQISESALTKLIADTKAATAATKEFQNVASVQIAAQDANNLAKAANALEKSSYSFAERQAILSDSALTELFLSGKNQKLLQARVKQILNPEFLQGLFDEGFNAAMNAISVKERKIELDFEVKTQPDLKIIDAAQNDIDKISFTIDDLQAGIKEIADQEDVVNKKYADRSKALSEIKEINSDLVAQQKAQLTVADALSRGDIAAAAKAAQDLRATQAQTSIDAQQKALELSKEKELATLVSSNGKTRKQLEDEIKKLQDEIFAIEEKRLEPAQERIRLADIEKQALIDSVTVLDKTRLAWQQIESEIENSRIGSTRYTESISNAIAMVESLKTAWKNATPGETQVDVPLVSQGTGAQAPVAGQPNAEFKGTRPGPDHDGKKKGEVWVGPNATWKWDGKKWNKISNVGKVNAAKFNQGGYVAKMFAGGGLANVKFAKGGTDIVPAMLTPGEFVMRKYAVENFGLDNMKAINNGTYSGESVYNYSINVNVQTDANADQIARNVMTQIKRIDSQRIRGNRF